MNTKDFVQGLERYCELRIVPQIESSFGRIVFRSALNVVKLRMEELIKLIPPALGIVDENGNLDLELMEKAISAAFEKQPQFTLWGGALTFRKEDLSDFIRVVHGQE